MALNDGIIFIPPTGRQLDALMGTDLVRDLMAERGEAGVDYAQDIAPVDTGDYRGNFRVEEHDGDVLLVNDDPAAAAIEWGRDGGEGHHTLSQAADWLEKGGD